MTESIVNESSFQSYFAAKISKALQEGFEGFFIATLSLGQGNEASHVYK